jgi:predicted membrane metal-binding protein
MGGNNLLMKTDDRPGLVIPRHETIPIRHYSRKRIALAFGAAALSDFLAMWTDFLPPVQWALDLGTAAALFLILGRRWALLPGLLVEAIPGMGVFPVWILVVLSLVVYDEIKTPRR